jgi:tetratricopeptide (TPR) repeat protein
LTGGQESKPVAKIQWFDRLLDSRASGVLLVVGFAVCVFVFGRGWFARSPAPQTVTLVPIEHPAVDSLEPLCRKHLQAVRERCEAITSNPKAPVSHRGRAFGELGKLYLAYSFAPAAVSCLRNAVLLDPDDFHWSYCLALGYEDAGQSDEALDAMRRARQAMRTDVRAEPADILAAVCFTGECLSRLNKSDEAEQTLEEALKLQPKCVYALAKLGQLASESGRPEKAIDCLQRALTLDRDHTGIRYRLAAAYRQCGDLDKASQVCPVLDSKEKMQQIYWHDSIRLALDELNLSSTRQVRLGATLTKAGRFGQAVQYFARALQANPDNHEARTQYGLALLNMGKYDEASKQLELVLQKDPGQDKARWGLCLAYAAVPASREKAVSQALTWSKAHPESLSALQVLADVYAKEHRFQEAHDAYAEAARRDPSQPWARLGCGVMLAALGRHVDARQYLQEATKTFPNHEQLRHNLARLLVTAPDEKARDGAQGLKLSKELFTAQATPVRAETLAMALAENGRFDKAIEQQQWAIEHFGHEGSEVGDRFQKVMRCFQTNKPFREPWPFSDPESH